MKKKQHFTRALLNFLTVQEQVKQGRPSKCENKKSKVEAFFDLWNKTEETYVSPSVKGLKTHTMNNIRRQCLVSISDLSKDWGWDRKTVRGFLDSLSNLGTIRREKYPLCELITWLVDMRHRDVCNNHFHDIILNYVRNVLDKWVRGEMDNKRAGQLIAEYWSTDYFGEFLKTENTLISHDEIVGPNTPKQEAHADELSSKILNMVVVSACKKSLHMFTQRFGNSLTQNNDVLLTMLNSKKIGWPELLEEILLIPLLPLDMEEDIILPYQRGQLEERIKVLKIGFRNRLVSLLMDEHNLDG